MITLREFGIFGSMAIAFAGAGLLAGKVLFDEYETKGVGKHWGHPATSARANTKIAPNRLAFIYVNLADAAGADIRKVYFDDANVLATAGNLAKIVKRFETQGMLLDRNAANVAIYGPVPMLNRAGSKTGIAKDFRHFQFGRPTKIAVYLGQANGKTWFDDLWPIMFTQHGVSARNSTLHGAWPDMSKNRTFYNADATSELGAPEDKPNLLVFDNLYRSAKDPDGDGAQGDEMDPGDVASQQANYSFNFNLWIESKAGGKIPIVIDPDTGNGNGQPPPIPG